MDFLHKEEKLEDKRRQGAEGTHMLAHHTDEAGCCGIKIATV